jgi:uncharacterized protein (TIGR02266 family)
VANNNRISQRYEVDLRVEVQDASGGWREGHTRNASLGGLFLMTSDRPAAGTRVPLRLHLPGGKAPLEVVGIVRWSDDVGVGVQFDGLRAKDVWALGKYFDSR